MESIQIYLNSAEADKYNGSASDVEYYMQNIEIAEGHHIFLSVQNCTIPYTFYNVNNNNNKLYYKLQNHSQEVLIIDIGNYNITQLVDYLNLNIGLEVIYNVITNKLTFKHPTSDFSILPESNCLTMLGLVNGEFNTSISQSLTSINCVNIMSIKRINLLSNFATYNINNKVVLVNNSNILCSIPVNKPPYSLIEYSNTNHFRSNLFINVINKISIRLIDEYDNLIDLNGCHYSITIQLDVESFK